MNFLNKMAFEVDLNSIPKAEKTNGTALKGDRKEASFAPMRRKLHFAGHE